jgi:hypothetical protein
VALKHFGDVRLWVKTGRRTFYIDPAGAIVRIRSAQENNTPPARRIVITTGIWTMQ